MEFDVCELEPYPAQAHPPSLTQVPSKCLEKLQVSSDDIDANGISALDQAQWRQLKHLSVRSSHQDATFAFESLAILYFVAWICNLAGFNTRH